MKRTRASLLIALLTAFGCGTHADPIGAPDSSHAPCEGGAGGTFDASGGTGGTDSSGSTGGTEGPDYPSHTEMCKWVCWRATLCAFPQTLPDEGCMASCMATLSPCPKAWLKDATDCAKETFVDACAPAEAWDEWNRCVYWMPCVGEP